MIANIASDDALILPHRANPAGLNFRERQGGNLTGVVTLNVEVAAKRLELLHELVPTATIVALLVNPTSTALAETTTRTQSARKRPAGRTD